MEIQLQSKKENTCVACSSVNLLRHLDLDDPPIEQVVQTLTIKRLGENGGSFTTKAMKYLAKQHGLIAECSRPPYLITDPRRAAEEVVTRWQALLQRGFIGILHHRPGKGKGHAVVLFDIEPTRDDWTLWTYDSAARSTGGLNGYSAIDFFWCQTNRKKIRMQDATPELIEMLGIKPTGRTAWFFKPLKLNP